MQRDRGPHRVDILLRYAVAAQEVRAAFAPSTSKRSLALLCRYVSPTSWNIAPA
jgi:hypothetical protein